jgi:prolyl-tRNA synthetase
MHQSRIFIPTHKLAPKDAEVISHKMMIRAGMIKQVAAGIYAYLPLGLMVLQNIERIIREEMEMLGASELLLPALTPADLWKESGRLDKYGPELMRLKDRKDREFLLGPTHEEVITFVTRDFAKSYKKLPIALYQIQTKFRDELRPRFALMRSREFSMKDLYTFHASEEDLNIWYQKVWKVYLRIFDRCGLDVKVVNSDTGQMGGKSAHEFMVISEVGEDTITYCDICDYAANIEYSKLEKDSFCPNCAKQSIKVSKGIEVGNIFKLGTKYSESMNAYFMDENGKQQPIVMGCYGLGVSRTLMAVIEHHYYENGLIFPRELRPFAYHILVADTDDNYQMSYANELHNLLQKSDTVLFDDRSERLGSKFQDADLIGSPIVIVIGKEVGDGFVDVIHRVINKKDRVAVTDLMTYLEVE